MSTYTLCAIVSLFSVVIGISGGFSVAWWWRGQVEQKRQAYEKSLPLNWQPPV